MFPSKYFPLLMLLVNSSSCAINSNVPAQASLQPAKEPGQILKKRCGSCGDSYGVCGCARSPVCGKCGYPSGSCRCYQPSCARCGSRTGCSCPLPQISKVANTYGGSPSYISGSGGYNSASLYGHPANLGLSSSLGNSGLSGYGNSLNGVAGSSSSLGFDQNIQDSGYTGSNSQSSNYNSNSNGVSTSSLGYDQNIHGSGYPGFDRNIYSGSQSNYNSNYNGGSTSSLGYGNNGQGSGYGSTQQYKGYNGNANLGSQSSNSNYNVGNQNYGYGNTVSNTGYTGGAYESNSYPGGSSTSYCR